MSFELVGKYRSVLYVYLAFIKSYQVSLIWCLARIFTLRDNVQSSRDRGRDISPVYMCVCFYVRFFIHSLTVSAAHHSLWCPQLWTVLTDLWSSALALRVRGIDSDRTKWAEPRSHRTPPWNHRFISGSCSHSSFVWCRHISPKMCQCYSKWQEWPYTTTREALLVTATWEWTSNLR